MEEIEPDGDYKLEVNTLRVGYELRILYDHATPQDKEALLTLM